MQFNLLTNGIDSLRGSYERLERIEHLVNGVEHNVKDAIMLLNHANEILFKLILKKQNEYLMFESISSYMRAKEAMIQQGKKNVFDINPNLKTVNFSEAIKRIEYLCNIPITKKFKGSLQYLNDMRNKIMHYEVELSNEDVLVLIKKLKACQKLSLEFFTNHLKGIEILYQTARFEQTIQDYEDDMGQYYSEANYEEDYLEYIEGAYEDLGEGKW